MTTPLAPQNDFAEITRLIATARQRAVQAVNTALIDLYWQVGQIISRKIAQAEWGDGVVAQLAEHLARTQPGLRGFTRPNLFRMRQFYETYRDDEKVSALLRQLPWTHNLIILSQSKRPEEREFYLQLAIREQWSSRELERQFKAALFERTVLNPPKVSAVLSQIHPDALSVFKDSYLVEFLDLPRGHAEAICA
jgi:predicted nuclease of restriction endonuclease-like (RecB) superfamily